LLGEVVVLEWDDTDKTFASILGASNGLLDEGGLLGGRRLGNGLLLQELVDGLLVVRLGLAKTVHAATQGVVSGLTNVLVLHHVG
jgi:hypothetical protein